MNKVGIFSARTPNRFVGFFLVVEGELELGLSITARSVGWSYIIVDTVDTVDTRTHYISFGRRLFWPLPLLLPPPTTKKRRRELSSIQIYKQHFTLLHSQLFIHIYCSSLSVVDIVPRVEYSIVNLVHSNPT